MPDPTAANLRVFFTGLETKFWYGYSSTPEWSKSVAMTEPSDTELETYGWMDRLPAMREWIGSRQIFEPVSNFRALVNRHWEITGSIPANKFKDDKHGIYGHIVEEHGRQSRKQNDYQIASTMEANPTGYDNVAFFSTAHPTDVTGQLSAATQSNDLQTLALNPSNFATAKAQMRGWVGRDGKPFGSGSGRLLLVVPVALEEAATVLQKAKYISPQTYANEATNVGVNENIYQGTFDVLVVPELTHPKIWYLLETGGPIKAFLIQLREAINMVVLTNPTDPNVFFMREYVYGGDMRSAYDVTLWWLALRCGAGL